MLGDYLKPHSEQTIEQFFAPATEQAIKRLLDISKEFKSKHFDTELRKEYVDHLHRWMRHILDRGELIPSIDYKLWGAEFHRFERLFEINRFPRVLLRDIQALADKLKLVLFPFNLLKDIGDGRGKDLVGMEMTGGRHGVPLYWRHFVLGSIEAIDRDALLTWLMGELYAPEGLDYYFEDVLRQQKFAEASLLAEAKLGSLSQQMMTAADSWLENLRKSWSEFVELVSSDRFSAVIQSVKKNHDDDPRLLRELNEVGAKGLAIPGCVHIICPPRVPSIWSRGKLEGVAYLGKSWGGDPHELLTKCLDLSWSLDKRS